MSNVSRNLDLVFTGHACDTVAAIKSSASTVFVNGKPIARQYDLLIPHNILVGDSCVPHIAIVNKGSSKIFAEGIGVARVGDSADSGFIIDGSSNVFSK